MNQEATKEQRKRERARKQSLALYQVDLERLEEIRKHYRLDSMSQAARRAIEDVALVAAHEAARRQAA